MINSNLVEEMTKLMSMQFHMHIDSNIYSSQHKLTFAEATKTALMHDRDKLSMLSASQLHVLCETYKRSFIDVFQNINQYIYFSQEHELAIDGIYHQLFSDLIDEELTIESIEHAHFERIKNFISKTNPAIYDINNNASLTAKSFVCAEYSATFLINLLGIDAATNMEPILDIGCGSQGILVQYFNEHNLSSFGIDRNAVGEHMAKVDWFAFDYGIKKWGLIISNLSFTSHFLFHHLHKDKLCDEYASTYMDILASLKVEGAWVYAPTIPFLEELLPRDTYAVTRESIHQDFMRTMIHRLR